MVSVENRLIIFFAAEDGEALYSQQKKKKKRPGVDCGSDHELEKEMATHSSILAWRIPGTEEPGGLPSMGPHRVGHD